MWLGSMGQAMGMGGMGMGGMRMRGMGMGGMRMGEEVGESMPQRPSPQPKKSIDQLL
jgi:hypothetical protein